MRIAKKLSALTLALIIVFSFSACAGNDILSLPSSSDSDTVNLSSSGFAEDSSEILSSSALQSSSSTVSALSGTSSKAVQSVSSDSVSSAKSIVFSAVSSTAATQKAETLKATFLDVGQGDSEFIILPDGKTILIDAANNGDGTKISAYLKKIGIVKIDYLIATHPHADHIGGIDEIINTMQIGKIFAPKIDSAKIPTTVVYKNFLTAVANKKLKITSTQPGGVMFSGSSYSAICYGPCGSNYSDLNNYSIVFKLSFKKTSFLFTGDANSISEKEILARQFDLNSTVLKVGHHGSATSSTTAFLNAVTPSYAVISCGKGNNYGHPAAKTVTALKTMGCMKQVFRTDLDKSVIFVSNGSTVSVQKGAESIN